MNPSSPTVSPLRQRMIDDMRMRKLEVKTRTGYLRAVKKLAVFLARSPDTATVEDLRRFQLYLVDQGTSPITLNATITGLKFFFDVTLGRAELMAKMQTVRVPQKLPVVLSCLLLNPRRKLVAKASLLRWINIHVVKTTLRIIGCNCCISVLKSFVLHGAWMKFRPANCWNGYSSSVMNIAILLLEN